MMTYNKCRHFYRKMTNGIGNEIYSWLSLWMDADDES